MDIAHQFLTGLQQTTLLEFIAVLAGIVSVWLSRKANILVYPIGLINTLLFIYLSIRGQLYGEASVNLYYTIMSIYGWILWSRKDPQKKQFVLHITRSTKQEWKQHLLFFSICYLLLFSALRILQHNFAPGAVPWADACASATAYTAMWLMANKKTESWIWWMATNLISIPLYFMKGYVFSSVQFVLLLALAISGLIEWRKGEVNLP